MRPGGEKIRTPAPTVPQVRVPMAGLLNRLLHCYRPARLRRNLNRRLQRNQEEPDSQTHNRPPYQRGEWGIDKPRQRIAPESTSIRRPPLALFGRQPAISFVSPSAVTYFGLPSTIARPLRWQRSDGSSSVTDGGRQRGAKLDSGSSVARQEKRVLTNQSSPSPPAPFPERA